MLNKIFYQHPSIGDYVISSTNKTICNSINDLLKQLVSARNTYITCLIAELHINIKYTHTHTRYFKSKNNFKSLILSHTYICALKPSYSCSRI
jgi:hypothetical protein